MTHPMQFPEHFNTVIDGGYITFTYGVFPTVWRDVRLKFPGALFLMDSKSFRHDLHPGYKSKRKEKRLLDPEKQQKYDAVKDLRDFIWIEDCTSHAAQVIGAESDDLVSAFHLSFPKTVVVATDKDLHQVPGLSSQLRTCRGEQITSAQLLKKVPLYAKQSLPKKEEALPGHLVFVQSVFGDRSDSIPRLLPSKPSLAREVWKGFDAGKDLLGAFNKAHKVWGPAFILNLNLILMPGNMLRNHPISDPLELFTAIVDASYWDPKEFERLTDDALRSARDRYNGFFGNGNP